MVKKYGPGAAATALCADMLTLPTDSPFDAFEPVGHTAWSLIYPFPSEGGAEGRYASLFVGEPMLNLAVFPEDVSQSRVTGDCGLESLLVALSLFRPEWVLRNVRDRGRGVFNVTLHEGREVPGRTDLDITGPAHPRVLQVLLRDIVGAEHGTPVFNSYFIRDKAGRGGYVPLAPIWPLVIEDAIARYLGAGDAEAGYQILGRGALNQGVERIAFALTGRRFVGMGFSSLSEDPSEQFITDVPSGNPLPSWADMQGVIARKGIMIVSTASAPSHRLSRPSWFVPRHFFAVANCSVNEVTGTRVVEIINPWGVLTGDHWWSAVPYDELKACCNCSIFESPNSAS